MEGATEELLWQSEPEAESIVHVTLARSMNALLCARPKKLHDAIFHLSSLTQRPSIGSLEDSLWFLHKYVSDAAEKEYSLDQVLVPMIENSLKSRDSKHGGQAMILINWLFQDELLFEPLTKGLANIITRKNDRYLLLGWCVLVRALVDYDNIISQSPFSGIRERYNGLIKILSTCLPHLAGIVSQGSTLQDGFEMPSRLGVSAADCFLTLTETLTKIAESQHDKLKSDARAKSQPITLVPSTSDKKVKLASKSLLISDTGREYILWHHLDGMICLVQRLLAWSQKSRFLHAKGLEQVLKWLEEIKSHYSSLQLDESFLSRWENRTYTNDEFVEMQQSLFEHLCPFLIIKMLPLKAFDDRSSSVIYGNLFQGIMSGLEAGYECIAALLLMRAFGDFEFEDVWKLAAELCGRIHPQVLFPVLCSRLEQAVGSKNILKIKACLLSICTSLVVRGWESFSHPAMFTIRKIIETVLLWPSLDADSVSKAQHGCIDCLALMLCAELQAEESITNYAPGVSVVSYVIGHLIHDKKDLNPAFELDSSNCASAVPLPFRLCMANVLISACQNISKACTNQLAARVLPSLLHSIEVVLRISLLWDERCE